MVCLRYLVRACLIKTGQVSVGCAPMPAACRCAAMASVLSVRHKRSPPLPPQPSPAADPSSPAATAMLDDDLIELYCGMPPKDMSHADLRIHLQVLDMIQEAEMVLALHSSRTVPKERFRSRIVSVYPLAARYLGIDSETEMQLSAALLVWIRRTKRQALRAAQQQAVARC